MKETPIPQNLQSSSGKGSFNSHHVLPGENLKTEKQHKPKPALKYIRAAAKGIVGIFRVALFRKRKKTAADDNKTSSQIRNTSFSITDSSVSTAKSLATVRSSISYASSSGNASGQIATVNFSFGEISKATENFSPANIIGEGGFGTVYKGKLKDGSLVAIKRAKKDSYEKSQWFEFRNEILTLSKIEHLNLVRLLGYLEHGDERIIVVEYVGNGNLREHLDGVRGNGLEIAERLDIAIDVAHAVTYLHMYTDTPMIHRDIKASNVLVTEKLRAKVADFGFARLASGDPGATHISTQVKGTAGYVDPEYLRTYQLTEKSDVYSFGVLLVEMMTGRYPIESKRPLKERVTTRWAMQRLKEGEFVIAMDPRLRRSPASNVVVEKVLKLAQDCLAPSRQSRPSMNKCAEILWGIRKDFREATLISSSSTSHHSATFPNRDITKTRHLFGIEDNESHGFISA
ncbi:hypothetical protein SLE2022_195230 [Rubroshorea leprosula]